MPSEPEVPRQPGAWRPPRWARAAEALVVAAVTLFVAWPFLFAPGYVTGFDTITYTGPLTTVTFDALADGRLPQWNPDLFGGTVQLANSQAAVLYPVKWLFVGAGPQRALELMTVLHLAVLAAGTFALVAWRLRLRPPAAAVGTVAVVASGAVMARSVQFEQMSVIAWIPLVMVGIDVVLDRDERTSFGVAGTAVVTALLLVAGHPQQVLIAAPLVAAWAVARTVDRAAWRRLPLVAGVGVLALGLSAVQLLPMLLQLDDSASVGGRTLAAAASPNLSAKADQLPGTILGSIFAERPELTSDAFEAMGFVGVVVVVLALVGAGAGLGVLRLRATTAAMAMVATVGTIMALGPQCAKTPDDELTACRSGGSFYRNLYTTLPGLDQERSPARWMLVVVFALALLAAVGTDLAVRRRITGRSLAISAALAAVGATTLVAIDGGLPVGSGSEVALAWALGAVAAVAAVAALTRARGAGAAAGALALTVLVVVELGIPAANSVPRAISGAPSFEDMALSTTEFLRTAEGRAFTLTEERVYEPDYLVSGMRPNANALYGVAVVDGYDGGIMVTELWSDAVGSATAGGFEFEKPLRWQVLVPVDTDLMARWGVRWLLADETSFGSAEGWDGPVVRDERFAVYENPDWRGEALVYRRTAPGEGPVLTVDLPHLDADVAMVPTGTVSLDCDDDCAPIPARLERRSPEDLVVTVDDGPGGLLVVAEQNQPGWDVRVDGVPVSTVTVDGMNIGVEIGPGAHEVTLHYRAPGLRAGAAISLASLALVVALAVDVAGVLRRRRRSRATAPTTGDS